MKLRSTHDPLEFKAAVSPFLEADPVLHSVLLTNVEDRINAITTDPEPPVFLSLHTDGGQVAGAILCTAQRGIYLGGLPEEFVPAIVDACVELAPNPRIVDGTAYAALLLADEIGVRLGGEFRSTRRLRLHRLERFVDQKAPGAPRQAVPADLDVAAQMLAEFAQEADHSSPPDDQDWARARIDRGRIWLWENESQIVSLVAHQATVFGATRVGPVYTPPEHRGHGYASALTADVTRRLLATGSTPCLFTDLANPTSNKIYAAIGYHPVVDLHRFER
ncbi:GNAT family N-acetyltransferase [Kribbella sp. NPDC056861]|uniref:GNAT family N-acetyltransferase n=1 Tax=Kribbella sp. NPDC056861 TaxID=3154857 RepID=UPI00344422BD